MNASAHLVVAGRELSLKVRRSGTARRMSLRLAPGGTGVVVVLPPGVPEAEALRFARSHDAWIAARLEAAPDRVALAPGACVPLLGLPHQIRHRPDAKRGVWAEDGVIHACGRAEHVPRRVEAFLKAEARLLLAHRARDLAARIGRKPTRVSVRDTQSRWGSCSSGGALSFSWRLIMTPDWVLDYVVAHEVAHMAEMNHGPGFWAVVASLSDRAEAARSWLKRHGPDLHRYGNS